MLNHDLHRQAAGCVLRPLLESDENDVLTLWNQDWAIGTLWSAKTAPETYRSRFETYKANPDEFQCAVVKPNGEFVGTTGFRRLDAETARVIFLILYPDRGFPAAVPYILLLDYVFTVGRYRRAVFTCGNGNDRIQRMFTAIRAENTGRTDTVTSRYGFVSTRQHWQYDRDAFYANREYFAATFGVNVPVAERPTCPA